MQSEERLWREIAAVESGGDALEFRVDLLDAAGAGAIERSFAKIRSSSSIHYSCRVSTLVVCSVVFYSLLRFRLLHSSPLSSPLFVTSLLSSPLSLRCSDASVLFQAPVPPPYYLDCAQHRTGGELPGLGGGIHGADDARRAVGRRFS